MTLRHALCFRRTAATLVGLALAGLLTAGCANVDLHRKQMKKTEAKRPAHWSSNPSSDEGEGKGGVFDAMIHGFGNDIAPGVDPVAFYRQQYALWRRDHMNLGQMVSQNAAGTGELLRQVVGSIGGMKEMLDKPEQRDELARIQERYESIALKSKQGLKASSFSLALDKIRWKIEKEYAPGTAGLTYRPATYFTQKEEHEFEDLEEKK